MLKTKTPHEAYCLDLLKKVMSDGIDSFELAEIMFGMEKKHPGKGWAENAAVVLKNYYLRRGMSEQEAANMMPS